MRIVLFRHGIAVDRDDPDCPPDAERPLTARGIRRTTAAARGLARLGVDPDAILVSPLVRAVETARIAAGILDHPDDPVRTPALEPEAPRDELFEELMGLEADTVLAVGHAPHLDLFLAEILGLPGDPPFRLGKAGAAAVDSTGDPGTARLLWMLTPRALRRLGR